ncbi:hypothetical protein FRC96_06550 [Lujinxingia vulgaris]|uniref:Uncharacterized protein n=1 Tax=Lujinxingia vulgaris TaxID=2600176 RepID=A0A5C6XGL8_9DELT|nr:hypothetical protein [Lujinxingia vulgaris]TXD39677.1 hypothetical protein FRC96_06550 [Lujinxingia vulgaris]
MRPVPTTPFPLSNRALLAAIGIIAAALVATLGYRGTTPDGLAMLERGLTRAQGLRTGDLGALLSLEGIYVADLAATFFSAITPAFAARWMHLLNIACVALSTLFVGAMALRLGGPRSALAAALVALCALPWLGLAGAHAPDAMIVTLTLAFLWLWTAPTIHPLGIAAAATLLAMLGLSWIGAFALAVLLVAAELLGDRDAAGGIILRLDHLLILIFGTALFLAFPGFWPDPAQTLPDVFLEPLLASGPELVYRGHTYPPARPPLTIGLMTWVEATSPAVLVAMLLGLYLARPWRWLREQRLARALVALLLASVLLPWLARGPSAWGVEMSALAIAALAILCAPGLAHLTELEQGSKRTPGFARTRLALVAGLIAVSIAPAFFGPPDVFEATRYPLPSRVFSGPAAHDAPARTALLPVDFLAEAHKAHGAINPGEFRATTDLYVAMGALSPAAIAPSETTEDLPRLIALPQFGAGPTWRAVGAGSAWRPGTLAPLEGGGHYGVLLPPPATETPSEPWAIAP